MLVPRFCPRLAATSLTAFCFHGSRNEDAFLSVIVAHGKSHGDDGTAIFHLKDVDVSPFSLYAPFSDEQGVFGKDMLSLNHPSPTLFLPTLTADYSLVPVDAGTYGIPHVFSFLWTNRGVWNLPPMSFPLMTRNRTGCGNDETTEWETSPTGTAFMFSIRPASSSSRRLFILCRHYPACIWLRALVGLFQKCHLFLITRLCILSGNRSASSCSTSASQGLLFRGLPAVTRKSCRESC